MLVHLWLDDIPVVPVVFSVLLRRKHFVPVFETSISRLFPLSNTVTFFELFHLRLPLDGVLGHLHLLALLDVVLEISPVLVISELNSLLLDYFFVLDNAIVHPVCLNVFLLNRPLSPFSIHNLLAINAA